MSEWERLCIGALVGGKRLSVGDNDYEKDAVIMEEKTAFFIMMQSFGN